MTTIGPRTDREGLIAELAHLQGYTDGTNALSQLLRQRGLKALAALDMASSDILDDADDRESSETSKP